MRNRVNDRGQITIERELREQLGVEPGMVAHQRIVDGHLEIVFLPPRHSESLYGALRHAFPHGAPVGQEEIEEAVIEALEQARRAGS